MAVCTRTGLVSSDSTPVAAGTRVFWSRPALENLFQARFGENQRPDSCHGPCDLRISPFGKTKNRSVQCGHGPCQPNMARVRRHNPRVERGKPRVRRHNPRVRRHKPRVRRHKPRVRRGKSRSDEASPVSDGASPVLSPCLSRRADESALPEQHDCATAAAHHTISVLTDHQTNPFNVRHEIAPRASHSISRVGGRCSTGIQGGTGINSHGPSRTTAVVPSSKRTSSR
jgi:hypothetical protein